MSKITIKDLYLIFGNDKTACFTHVEGKKEQK